MWFLALAACNAPKTTGDAAAGDSAVTADSAPLDSGGDTGADSAAATTNGPANPDIPTANCKYTATNSNTSTYEVGMYNGAGEFVVYAFYGPQPDRASDDRTDSTTWYDGHAIDWIQDLGNNGTVDAREAWSWNGDEEATYAQDYDGADPWDTIWTFAYDGAGVETGFTRDDGGDGTPDSAVAYTYDADGHWIGATEDDGLDGTIDTRWVQVVTVDDAGNTVFAGTEDYDDDGMIDATWTQTYDAADHELAWARDDDNNGVPDSSETWTYDADLLTTSSFTEYYSDGSPYLEDVASYDAWGRWVGDSEKSGSDSVIWTAVWTCSG